MMITTSPSSSAPSLPKHFGALGHRLSAGDMLSAQENALLADATKHPCVYEAGHEFIVDYNTLERPELIMSGWAAEIRTFKDGRRQIVDTFISGDITCFARRCMRRDLSYICLTRVTAADASSIVAAAQEVPSMHRALSSAVESMENEMHWRLIEQIARVGRLHAPERIASLMLELHARFARVGLSNGEIFPMPLTQDILGDLLGMSTVHVNRTLQQMRRADMLKTTSGHWQILNRPRVSELAVGQGHQPGHSFRD